jgi:prepilin signal peptidase PulO-like enzyme (type II secretory pathway)
MTQIGLALLGLFVGAALNALADDLPNRVTLHPPHCPACGQPHHPWQWFAIIAFIGGRGQCAYCGTPLPIRRLLVEIVAALLPVFLLQKFGPTLQFSLLALLLEGLLLITVIDLEHRLILYVTVFPMAAIALFYGLFGAERSIAQTLIGGAVGYGVFYFFYLLSWAFEAIVNRLRGEPLSEVPFGGGDVNLAGVVGLAVGWPGIILAIFFTVMAGGGVAALYFLFKRLRGSYIAFTPIPYGPFIVFGAFLLLVFSAEIKRFYGS